MTLAVLALVSVVAGASPPAAPKRIAVLMVPMDRGAEAATVRLETYMNEALEQLPGLQVKKSEEAFGLPPDEEAEASLKRAETGYGESRLAFDARETADAERKLRATLKEYTKAAGAMKECGHLCDAIAMYASTLQERGDVDEAKIALVDLIALAPTFALDSKRFTQELIMLRSQVATGRSGQMRGSLAVGSRPPGARVYLDGELQGYTPTTLQTLQVGKHLVRLERPGFQVLGLLAEVTPEDTSVEPELTATAAYKSYEAMLGKISGEVAKDKGGSALAAVAKTLGVDRGIVGLVKQINEAGGTELNVGFYELKTGKRLASKRQVFQGDEYGQLKSEIGRLVNALVNYEAAEKSAKSADPLESRHGTEEWNSEDRGNHSAPDKKKKAKDPLDGVNGTEEW